MSSGLALHGGTCQLDFENSDGRDGSLSRNANALGAVGKSASTSPLLCFSPFMPHASEMKLFISFFPTDTHTHTHTISPSATLSESSDTLNFACSRIHLYWATNFLIRFFFLILEGFKCQSLQVTKSRMATPLCGVS